MTDGYEARATTGELVARRRAGRYHRCGIVAPGVVETAVAGQFVSVGVEASGTVLRRPFAIADVDPDAGVLDLVVAAVGVGSSWLVTRPVGTRLELTGPLGRGFREPDAPTHCVLVGGGYGVAALEWLGRRLLAAGNTVDLLSGAATAGGLVPVRTLDAAGATLVETTDDGSRGRRGQVTDALRDRLTTSAATVFACGPMPMLAAVAAIARRAGVACQVAVEAHMGCSIGVCMTCVVPTFGGYVRACVEGPVMDAASLDWDEVVR